MRKLYFILLALFITIAPQGHAESYVRLELGETWQSRNDQRIPGEGGTGFSIAELEKGPLLTGRVYLGYKWLERHELRALYAPLVIQTDGQFNQAVQFNGTNFLANTDTNILYQFNSYRLTYAYHYPEHGNWRFALGFTAKVRDAKVRLSQGALESQKSNVGFVPLLHFQADYNFGETWSFGFDFDGLAAKQGRAVDAALFLRAKISPRVSGDFGYRTVEGGADNKDVYNFAWFNTFFGGLRIELL